MFGRKPRLPIDLILWTKKDFPSKCSHKKYQQHWKKEMECAFEEKKDVQRKLKSGPCLGIPVPSDKNLVRNFVTKRKFRKTEVVLGTRGCRSNTKT